MPKWTRFADVVLDLDTVLAVESITTVSTGAMSCDWDFGFTVKMAGNEVSIRCPKASNFGYSQGPSRDEYLSKAEHLRTEFLLLLQDSPHSATTTTDEP